MIRRPRTTPTTRTSNTSDIELPLRESRAVSHPAGHYRPPSTAAAAAGSNFTMKPVVSAMQAWSWYVTNPYHTLLSDAVSLEQAVASQLVGPN